MYKVPFFLFRRLNKIMWNVLSPQVSPNSMGIHENIVLYSIHFFESRR